TIKLLDSYKLLGKEKSRPSLKSDWQNYYDQLSSNQRDQLKSLIKDPKNFKFIKNDDNKSKAEILEASLKYIALKEYREQKEYKEDKYLLELTRAKLGLVTTPLYVSPKISPLKSTAPIGLYLSYGQTEQESYLGFKYRRAFHDLLSDDSGLNPFTHLEIFSFEIQYYLNQHRAELSNLTLINVLSSNPTTALNQELSWLIDIGTKEHFSPYLDFGFGSSFNLFSKPVSRSIFLMRLENRLQDKKYFGFLGPEFIFVSQLSSHSKSVFDVKYLYSMDSQKFLWDHRFSIAFFQNNQEIRFEYKERDLIPNWLITYLLFY
ncbi:MAG: hypothetical protein KDD45_16860, partial [Bdellovibrionales bacterium]|nr:hypothetical protein [Bdellovibrionales bacterium]